MIEKIIIDLEFTGLDNQFINDNEIVEVKLMSLNTSKTACKIFDTKKKIDAGALIKTKINQVGATDLFSKEEFHVLVESIKSTTYTDVEFILWRVSLDIKMLGKYDISIPKITDVQELLRLTSLEQRMAIEGSSLECCYYYLTNNIVDIQHNGIDELKYINELYQHILFKYVIPEKLNQLLNYVPFGAFAGMPISDYVIQERRKADGYRYNNNDLFSRSLDYAIEATEMNHEDEDYQF